MLNAFLDYTPLRFKCGTIYLAEDINLSFTIHTKYGVIKPIVRNPHQKDIGTVANEMRDLTRRARKTDANILYRNAAIAYLKSSLKQCDVKELGGLWMLIRSLLFERVKPDPEFKDVPQDQQLQVSDMLGATCTLANIGSAVDGHQTLTVITPPEVAMFGLSDIHLAPTVVDGQVVPRNTVTLFSTIDHRAYDAGEVFPFIQHLKRYINDPARIYEWKPGDEI